MAEICLTSANFEKEVMEFLESGKISTGHAKVLLGISDKNVVTAQAPGKAEIEKENFRFYNLFYVFLFTNIKNIIHRLARPTKV